MTQDALLLCFEEDAAMARSIANASGFAWSMVSRHYFPDGEVKLRLPDPLPQRLVVLRTLDHPNDKLVELLLIAGAARDLGANHLTLVAPYLAYMRQDMAFQPGEVVSQKVIGKLLAAHFDALITVDPHLHRVSTLQEAVPVPQGLVLSGAPLLASLIAKHHERPLLIGPDEESAQWIAQAAASHGFEFGVCQKVRHGDRDVAISLPVVDVVERSVVLLDDVASSGHTVAVAARLLLAAGASSVDVAVTHALFSEGSIELLRAAGIGQIWSTDTIRHPTNAVSMATPIAQALLSQNLVKANP